MSLKIKTKVKSLVRTMTRTAVLHNTATQFLDVGRGLGAGTDWYQDRIQKWVANELICALDIVLWDGDDPIAGVNLTFDWHEHKTICSIKNEVDVDFEEGETFVSTKDIMAVIAKYLGDAKALANRPHASIWYTTNPEARDRLGADEFERLLDHHDSAASKGSNKRDWSKVRTLQATRKTRRTVMPDVSEVSTTAY